jgi:hypothetical protein
MIAKKFAFRLLKNKPTSEGCSILAMAKTPISLMAALLGPSLLVTLASGGILVFALILVADGLGAAMGVAFFKHSLNDQIVGLTTLKLPVSSVLATLTVNPLDVRKAA